MTREEFAKVENDPCRHCGGRVILEVDPHIENRVQIVCANTTCSHRRRPWGLVIFLDMNRKKQRDPYPFGQSLDEVWDRFGNTCILCGITRSECEVLGISRERQHTMEYVKTGHEGPILPICGQCHPIATNMQKLRAFMRRVLSADVEPVPHGRS